MPGDCQHLPCTAFGLVLLCNLFGVSAGMEYLVCRREFAKTRGCNALFQKYLGRIAFVRARGCAIGAIDVCWGLESADFELLHIHSPYCTANIPSVCQPQADIRCRGEFRCFEPRSVARSLHTHPLFFCVASIILHHSRLISFPNSIAYSLSPIAL